MKISEAKLRQLISEEVKRIIEAASSLKPEDKFSSKISSLNLDPEFVEIVITVKKLEDKIKKSLDIDSSTLGLLLVAAISVSGRESSYGKGRRYQWTSWAETLASEYGIKDMSIGPTQIKYGENFGPKSDLSKYGKDVDIQSPTSLSEYPKAIMATIGILSKLYKKALSLGYTKESGKASKDFKSTGNAALDLALIGYNMGDSKVTNYCGNDQIKKPCPLNSDNIVKNYIPNFVDGSLSSLGYVSEVSSDMLKFIRITSLF